MDVEATSESPLSAGADAVALAVFAGEELGTALPDAPLRSLLDAGEARPAFKHVAHTHVDGVRAILVGLGARGDLSPERARVAAAVAFRRARELGARTLCWELPAGAGDDIAAGLVQGSVLSAYRFGRYRPAADPEANAGPQRLLVSAGSGPAGAGAAGAGGTGAGHAGAGAAGAGHAGAVARAATVAAAQNRARDLGNRPPNDLTPAALGAYAAGLAGRVPGLEVAQLGGAQIRELGMGAFAAVAQGSDEDPRLIVLRYAGGAAGAPRLALIGKAVTFDSGGLWLKPNASMIEMKFDMAGGAAVIEAIAALAEMGAPVNVLGVVGATENMISGRATRPGDIVSALDGTTVEINNTDAEGRLVLADCITYARREGCAAIVDVATLTGAVVTALGSVYAGLMANDDALAARITECGESSGELVWRLPLHPGYAELIKGRYAQISNRTERREAAAITAAEFLHHFAGDVPWAHLDIAGVGDNGHREYLDRGATGFGVRLLTELALSF